MSTSIKVAWDCECKPPYVTGYIDKDSDSVRCYRCDGIIAGTEQITTDRIKQWNKDYEKATGIKL